MRILRSIWLCLLVGGLAACVTGSSSHVRSWVDAGTAVTITAQIEPMVLSREDFPAGVNVRDYVEVGAFEINRSGDHKHYLAFTLWSTIDRSPVQWLKIDGDFSTVTLWADDRPLLLKRTANNYAGINISTAVFGFPSPNAREMYYEVSLAQLDALARARRWTMSFGGLVDGEQLFTLWRGSAASLSQFIVAIGGVVSR
jgi:hypothetical protein